MRTWDPLDGTTEAQRQQLQAYEQLLLQLNRRFNLVAGSTEDAFWELHALHSLTLALRPFPAGCTVVDWGTGGGLPAIPLAIRFPEVRFIAVDAVGKKVQAVKTMARRLGLDNLAAWNGRAERWPGTLHYSVSRATAPLADLWSWHRRAVSPLSAVPDDAWVPGLLCLKGGDLKGEVAQLHQADPRVQVETMDLAALTGRRAFRDKCLVQVTARM